MGRGEYTWLGEKFLLRSPERIKEKKRGDETSGSMGNGICGLYERKLKEINPAIRNLSYDISDLYNFIDGLTDLSALVYDHSIQAYLPYDREWIKQKTLQHLKKLAQ
ncbi:Enhancer of rudimentary-like protein [Abeliophyllum distichum]|uniref:Enhancer of rudimentary-like protein n=1 Tax=Abeliophyllum distichum TaxID=126358 RepID=A0ABD1UK38_9LAMI